MALITISQPLPEQGNGMFEFFLKICYSLGLLAAPTPTVDGSGIGTGASVQVFAANASRRGLCIQNNGVHPMYFNFGSAASAATGPGASFILQPGAAWSMESKLVSDAIYLLATTGDAYTAKQF